MRHLHSIRGADDDDGNGNVDDDGDEISSIVTSLSSDIVATCDCLHIIIIIIITTTIIIIVVVYIAIDVRKGAAELQRSGRGLRVHLHTCRAWRLPHHHQVWRKLPHTWKSI